MIDRVERLRTWPYSPAHCSDDETQHCYAIVSAFSARVQLGHDQNGGTRASVVLPVLRGLD